MYSAFKLDYIFEISVNFWGKIICFVSEFKWRFKTYFLFRLT